MCQTQKPRLAYSSRPLSSEGERLLLPAGGRPQLGDGASTAQDPTSLTRLKAGALASEEDKTGRKTGRKK